LGTNECELLLGKIFKLLKKAKTMDIGVNIMRQLLYYNEPRWTLACCVMQLKVIASVVINHINITNTTEKFFVWKGTK